MRPAWPRVVGQARRQRAERLATLEAALRAHDRMIAMVGHDLRNPLSVMLLTARMLKGASPAELEVMATRLKTTGRRMLRIIDQLADVAEARVTGGLVLDCRPTALRPILDRVLADHALQPGHRVELLMADGVAGPWDELRLEQLLVNLLTAGTRRGVPDGATTLEVTHGDARVCLRLSHPGTFTEAERGAWRDPFSARRPGEAQRPFPLNLYLVQLVAHAHGGELRVDAEAGRTCVQVSLPGGAVGEFSPARA